MKSPPCSPLPPGCYANPVLSGFHPDPATGRVGEDDYATTSSFAYFSGRPTYHSGDLVNWLLIGHALPRPSQVGVGGADCVPILFEAPVARGPGRAGGEHLLRVEAEGACYPPPELILRASSMRGVEPRRARVSVSLSL